MTPQPYQLDIAIPTRLARPKPARSPVAKSVLPAPMVGRFHTGPRVSASPCPPEVVFVFEQFGLIDAESYQRSYFRKGGQALARGYYVVTWPEGRNDRLFGEEAVFHGPYRDKKDAENSLDLFRMVLSSPLRDMRPWPASARIPVSA